MRHETGGSHIKNKRRSYFLMKKEKEFCFDFPNETLQEILLNEYMKKTAKWLLGKRKGKLHAYYGNSHWEAALSIDFLSSLFELLDKKNDKKLRDDIYSTIHHGIRWLLSEKEVTNAKLVHWDGVTWDTSVVVRTTLHEAMCRKKAFSPKELDEIRDSSVMALAWLFKRFYGWEKEVKYPFGDADVAQILITVLFIKENYPKILSKAIEKANEILNQKKNEDDFLEDIVVFLISRKGMHQNREDTCFWEDFFQTAEVLEALTLTYVYFINLNKKPKKTTIQDLRQIIYKTLHTFEITQSRGMWSTHADTCRVLFSYVKCSKLVGIDPEPQIVFKSLRWLCDEKQTFKDGSFLHTSFITVFYALALMEVYKNWPHATKNTLELYDDVIWFMEASSSVERGKRLLVEKEYHELLDLFDNIIQKKAFLKRVMYVLIWSLAFSFIVFMTYITYIIVNPEIVSTFLLGILAIYVTVVGIILTVSLRLEKVKRRKQIFKASANS